MTTYERPPEDDDERPVKPVPEVDDDGEEIPGEEDPEFMSPEEAAADDTVDDAEPDVTRDE